MRSRALGAIRARMRPSAGGPRGEAFPGRAGPGRRLVVSGGGGVESGGTMSVGGSDRNEDFHQQLRLQELYERKEGEGAEDAFTYTDPADGTQYEWDREKKAWFPKVGRTAGPVLHRGWGGVCGGIQSPCASCLCPFPCRWRVMGIVVLGWGLVGGHGLLVFRLQQSCFC